MCMPALLQNVRNYGCDVLQSIVLKNLSWAQQPFANVREEAVYCAHPFVKDM